MPGLDALRCPLHGVRAIEASAGTGKTHTLGTLVLRLIAERDLPVDGILVVTYTRAATAELRSRLRDRMRSAIAALSGEDAGPEAADFAAAQPDPIRARQRLETALRRFDDLAVSTIHAFGQRLLRDHAVACSVALGAEVEPDAEPLVREVVLDFWRSALARLHVALVTRLLRRADLAPERLVERVREALADPDLRVVPQPVGLDPGLATARYAAACAAAQVAWQVPVPSVPETLRAALGDLSGRYWRADWLAGRCARVAAFLAAGPEGGLPPPEDLLRFTPTALAGTVKKGRAAPEHPFFAGVPELLEASVAYEADLADQALALLHRLLAHARTEVRARKEAARVLHHDDLLQRLDEALRGPGGDDLARAIRARYPVALIDEFQDTDPIQWRLFETLFAAPGGTLFLIGDPKQSIYRFRGADLAAYLRAVRREGVVREALAVNWRSDPGLVAAVNHVFGRLPEPFLHAEIPCPPVSPRPGAAERLVAPPPYGAPLELLLLPRAVTGTAPDQPIPRGWADDHLADAVAAEVARLLASGATLDGRPLRAGDVAVLVARNRDGVRVQRALAAVNVPAVVLVDDSVLQTPEASDLDDLLAALAAPRDPGLLLAALGTPVLGLDAAALRALHDDADALAGWTGRFARAADRVRDRGALAALRCLLAEADVPARHLGVPGGERRLANLYHLVEVLDRAVAPERPPAQALRATLQALRSGELPVAEADTAQLRLESDAEAVQVLTVHRSKGLEFPVVYCLQLWRDPAGPDHPAYLTYHDPAAGGQRTLDLAQPPDPERVALADLEARAEQLRLAYVALTRARHRVSVVWGAFRHAQRSPLAVLLHLGADVQAAPRPPLTPAPDLADAAVRAVDGRTDAELLADLRALAAGSAGTVAVRELTLEPATALARAGSRLDPPVARPRRAVRRILGRGSFSAWVAAAGAGEGPGDEALEVLGEPLAGPERSDPAPGAALGLPGGTRTGLALHAILEQVDLADLDHPPVRAVIDAALARHGLAAAGSGDAVERLVRAVARIPLGDGAARFRLGEVPRGRRVAEPRFVAATGPGAGRGQDPAALAELLRRPDAPVPPGYADRVAALGFEVPTGFLVGALDLLLEHQGRYWVVDWKSNDLGPAAEDYAPGALARAMADHHYLLQAHLYLVALHRHLASRLPGYRYADHVAGAAFVFLRGLPDDPAPGAAVHVVQPPADLIAALSGRLGRGAAVRA